MKIQLTISLLVSDRIETLGKCLDSLKPLLRELDSELICVFTGQDAKTLELVQQYASLVIPFTWCQDFAKARNAGLEQAKGEWFLYLDDDEWFDDTEEIIQFFKTREYKNYQAAFYQQRNYTDWGGKEYSDFSVGRMCCIRPETRFMMPIHEYLEPFPKPRKDFKAFVHHYGYVKKAGENLLSQKTERNLPLLLKRLEEAPDSDAAHCCMQIAQEYANNGKYQEAVRYCRKGLELSKKESQVYSVEMWMQVHFPVMISLSGDYAGALSEGDRILHSRRILEVTAANLSATLVNISYEMGEYKKSLSYVKDFRRMMEYLRRHPEIAARQKGGDITYSFAENRAVLTYISGLVCALETGETSYVQKILAWIPWDKTEYVAPHYQHFEEWKTRFPKHLEVILEGFSTLCTQDAYANLQKAYYAERQGQVQEAEKYWKICAGDCPDWLLWQPVQMAVRNHFSLSPLAGRISSDGWEECVKTLVERIPIPEMQTFYEDILPLLNDYPLFAGRLEQVFLEKQLSQGILETSRLLALLRRYCESSIASAKRLYREKALYGADSYALPPQYRFAVMVDKALCLIESGSFAGCTPLLRDAYRIYPKLTAVISQLIRYLTEQIEKPPKVVSEEFAALGKQVKGVLSGLMEKGQWEEAYGVTAQLIPLLPDDLEVLRMKQIILREGM